MLREIINRLVSGDAEFIQSAGLVAGIIDDDRMALHGQPVRAGKAGRSGSDDGDALAGFGGAAVELAAMAHRMVGGVPLQQADLHRLALGRLADAGLLAQGLGRTDTGAHAAKNVLVEDRARRPVKIAGRDLADEFWDVDPGRARRHAGRVIAKIAPVRRDHRLMRVERRVRVAEILVVVASLQPAVKDPILEIAIDHHRLHSQQTSCRAAAHGACVGKPPQTGAI